MTDPDQPFDPVVSGQAVFNRLLEARSRPGAVVPVGNVRLDMEPARLRLACAILLTLLDRDVGVRIVGDDAEAVGRYLRLNTRVRFSVLEDADFVLVTGAHSSAAIRRLHVGGSVRPLTLMYAPDAFGDPGRAGTVTLAVGEPPHARQLTVSGIAEVELEQLRAARRDIPVNVWLAAGDGGLAVIPAASPYVLEPAAVDATAIEDGSLPALSW